jgi:hypothetical protein
MKIFTDYDHTISKSLDYRLDKFITLKQNSINMMIQHKTKEVYNVNNNKSSYLTLSSEQPSAMSTKFLGQLALTIAHIVVNTNLVKSQHVLKKQKRDKSLKH